MNPINQPLRLREFVEARRLLKYRDALLQVLVDIDDPHPRMATLEGYRNAMRATADMVRSVLNGEDGE